MTQSHDEMLARVRAMAADYGQTWDLSPKDQEALRHMLAVVNELCACLESSTGIAADEVLRRVSESVWQRVRSKDVDE